MNIELLFENQQVELNDKVSFPLNKSFENLWNPTDIIVEYSKSINIPATAANNRLMANAYRLDRKFAINDSSANIGMFLDPLKRIPMKLMYNNKIILDGYAKYTSATVNNKETYYTFNLYGILGDIFQKLLECVVDENKLTDEQKAESDGGAKYVIACPWDKPLINKELIKRSWEDHYTSVRPTTSWYRNIGFAPAYRGLYDDFESTSILGLDYDPLSFDLDKYEVMSVEDGLKKHWKSVLKNLNGYTEENAEARVDALDFNVILPNGLNEHNMRQFRSYEQKPYIYFNALMKLYQDKCKELTGYDINLDPQWFNINNPYWSRLCYMFDYLSVKGASTGSSLPFTGYSQQTYTSKYGVTSVTYSITDDKIIAKDDIDIDPFTIMAQGIAKLNVSTVIPNSVGGWFTPSGAITLDIEVTTGGTTTHTYFCGGTETYDKIKKSIGALNKTYTEDNFIVMAEDTTYDASANTITLKTYMTTPKFTIKHKAGDAITIKYNAKLVAFTTANNDRILWRYEYKSTDSNNKIGTYFPLSSSFSNEWNTFPNNPDFTMTFPNVTYSSNWRTSTTCDLKNLYTKDDPLFNAILQYTKMFGLIWKTDYQNKTIEIMTRKSYFNDYQIVDWSNKVDKGKGLTIEPVSFNSKYVTFNYEDTEGYRYSGYKKKYGVDYGEKKLTTKYNFDTKETKLFTQKIYPSSISNKSYSTIQDLWDWNTLTTLKNRPSETNMIDCESDDEQSSISLNNWYFRLDNIGTDYPHRISDASEREIKDGKYYWLDNNYGRVLGCIEDVYTLPQFSPVMQSPADNKMIGCLFNCPNDDYTSDVQLATAKGNYIYDNCWSDFINEQYNANNKKVTAYIRLTPTEYEQFNFKTFVIIDNQLFLVNKIIDYSVDNITTKVELIQVSDISGYTNQRVEFPPVIMNDIDIYISPTATGTSLSYNYVGYGGIDITCYPSILNAGDFQIRRVSEQLQTSELVAYDWQAEEEDADEGDPLQQINAGRGTLIFRWCGMNAEPEEWEVTVTAFGETRTIPVHIIFN